MERGEGSGLLLRCRERRASSPGCDGDGGDHAQVLCGGLYVLAKWPGSIRPLI